LACATMSQEANYVRFSSSVKRKKRKKTPSKRVETSLHDFQLYYDF
jgi:hypothetical protein